MSTAKEDNVRVVVRCRPLLQDLEKNEDQVVKLDAAVSQSIQVQSTTNGANTRQFTYDHVFGQDSSQDEVYNKAAKHIVDCVLQGYNGTIFCYGQTGTGKTFTSSGIMEHSFEHIFEHISRSAVDHKFLVRASFYEIYNEVIRDLLVVNNKKQGLTTASDASNNSNKTNSTNGTKIKNSTEGLKLKETKDGSVVIKDLSYFVVNNVDDLRRLKTAGDKQRAFGSTKMNQRSSRSHTIFTITIEMIVQNVASNVSSGTVTNPANDSLALVRVGKFHLIDLAGSERQSKTGTTGTRLKEASNINLSLTSLSLVIAALTDPKAKFVPYRNSKLTRILSDSLGGNSKTLLIACIGPARCNLDETLSTLRFASQTKQIKNKPIINEDSKDALMRKFQEQIRELQEQLASEENDGPVDTANSNAENNKSVAKKVIPPELVNKLRALEAKICVGGENLIEKAEMQEKLIAESELEIRKRREMETQLQAELEQRQAEILQMEDSYASLQEEVVALNRKLKKAYGFLKESKAELEDMNVEHEKLRSELLDSIRTAEKEIKLTNALITYVIPEHELELVEQNASYNQMTGEWELRCVAYTGNNMKADFELNENELLHQQNYRNLDNIYLSYSSLNLNTS